LVPHLLERRPRLPQCLTSAQTLIKKSKLVLDQYAEAALGNREFFLNKPYGIGGRTKDNIP
jgi:hypothetical protein